MISEQDTDPNYLLKKHFPHHPFHQSLHNWASKNEGRPILHVDIHGKMNRKNNCEIDVGIRSMEAHWDGDSLVKKIRMFFIEHGKIFEGMKFGDFECEFNTDPYLHGYWGGGIHTMTEQAIILGIPSIQLEIPLLVRKKLFKDENLRKKFHELLNKLYNFVIVPDFHEKKRIYRISKEVGAKFEDSVKRTDDADLCEQLILFENKEEANGKGI